VPVLREVLLAVQSDGLNRIDLAEKRRGYYEDLDVTRIDRRLRFLRSRAGQDPWNKLLGRVQRRTDDFLGWELLPSTVVEFDGGTITVNRWGMRDRDYEQKKPQGICRIALLGSSHEFGRGLTDGLAINAQLEARLNADAEWNGERRQYEILNFAVGGYSAFQHLYVLENKALQFDPDVVMYVVNVYDEKFLVAHAAAVLASGGDCPYGIIQGIAIEAQITPGMSSELIEARLQPFAHRLHVAAIKELATICRAHECRPVLVFRPSPTAIEGIEREVETGFAIQLMQVGAKTGIPAFDLSSAFQNCDKNSLTISLWDDHTNARGHQLLADELFRQLSLPESRGLWQTTRDDVMDGADPNSLGGK
jgi:hypothetical protein